jgi:hypothetical protein
MPASGGAATRTLKLDRDLRDIVVEGDKLLVTKFRTAEVLVVGAEGKVWQRETPRPGAGFDPLTGGEQTFEPAVAWRMIQKPGGGAVMVHQRGASSPVIIEQPGGYGGTGGCDGSIVQSTVTEIGTGTESVPIVIPPMPNASLMSMALPVDIAIAPNGSQIAVAAAGNNAILRTTLSSVQSGLPEGCGDGSLFNQPVGGQPTAVAFFDNGKLAVQLREPAAIVIIDSLNNQATVPLPGETRADTGHDLFHKSPTGFGSLACASCHPEAMDDHRTWNFTSIGARRTQSIRGGILATAPLHWDGDMEDMGHIMTEVFVNRMGGPAGSALPVYVNAMERWLDSVPAAAAPSAFGAATFFTPATLKRVRTFCRP